MAEITLRPYQQKTYDEAQDAFRRGYRGVGICLPCRSGKSFIMAKMIDSATKKSNKVLLLAHRNLLLKQHTELLEKFDLINENVRVESVFTEANRLEQHDPNEIQLILIDEAHLSEAASYKKVCEYYANARRVLFSATFARLDGKPLTLAETLIQGIQPRELIKQGAISEFDYYAPDIGIDTSEIGTVAGDFNNGQLTELMCKPSLFGDIIKYYKMLADGQQAIAYCTSVKHSKEVCKTFNAEGITAEHIDGSMKNAEREAVMERYRHHETMVICCCNCISEGITLPNANVGLLLRPTQSLALYIQQACRVLTPMEGKRATIIDYSANFQRHGLPDEPREWSLTASVKKRREMDDEGNYTIRQCPYCFRCFKPKPVCPHCGMPYPLKPREISCHKEIELKKIEAEQAAKKEQERKAMRREEGMARSLEELKEIAKKRGYDPKWAYMKARAKKLI